ncbi:uncharacterized protein LOC107422567 [Ziziphus jujuba]|uniref:Uncharacterized protein LOC107422567 n=1 Tax=Ziziphus jujuba TaxID=326968 RepID=A0A6P4AN54_ZIZJJ|nr:uncharacterized protein LOC107422567 [Ziziphus jujuba]
MTKEARAGTSSQQFYKDTPNVVSNNRAAADRDVDNFCIQTGEEFSTEFLQDRAGLRRLAPVMTNVNQRLPTRSGLNYNQNHQQLAYEDLSGILGLRRVDSECSSEVSDFVHGSGYFPAEVDYKVHPNNINRYHWEYGAAIGQVPSKHVDNRDRVPPVLPTAPPFYVLDSPQAYHPYVQGFSDGSVSSKMRFLCSFGGRILPRPSDGKLRYVGGETRIISIRKNITWEELVKKTSTIFSQPHTIKYQLPGEDLDALISICSDEDLHHMLEEYLEQERTEGSQRLRLFLIPLNESESPSSVEARATQTNDVENQYVVAVNGMLEPSPKKSSSGHSLTSQTSQLGNTLEHSPRFHRDSPTSTYILENKDHSPRPPAQYTTVLQGRDPKNSDVIDRPYAGGDEGSSSFLMGKLPCQDSCNVDALSRCHGLPLTDNHNQTKYLVEADWANRASDICFHHPGPGGNFVSSAQNVQTGVRFERVMPRESSFHSNNSGSHQDHLPTLLSGTEIKDVPHNKMMHALSDSLLQEHYDRPSDGFMPLSSSKIKRDKLLPITRSSSSRECVMQGVEKAESQVAVHENQFTVKKPSHSRGKGSEELLKWTHRKNSSGDQKNWNHHEGNVDVKSKNNSLESSNLPNINYMHKNCVSSQELQIPEGMVSASPVTPLENLLDTRSLNSMHDQQSSTTQRISCQRSLRRKTPAASDEFVGFESLATSSKVASTVSSDSEASLHDKEAMNRAYNEIEILSFSGEAIEVPKFEYAISVQSQPLDDYHDNEAMESPIIVEDITGIATPGIPSSSRAVAYVEYTCSDDECTSPRETKADSSIQESSGEVENDSADGRDESISMSDAAIAEIEAGVYGLQIIKNDDLEELQELGSGTFGTVYHGKWRGTDVAIKRIKKSCFSGRSSEQERLIKDFWREARILSNLHHPNVVAFYGVVPDGPETTLATVTEFMVNGSLRHVLLKKDIVLDRRKRLLIAMDTAFGMEYLHLKNIVHFDLKCDNLLVNLRDSERPICKVGDFGLSRIKRNTLVSGGVRGTLPWMAPELLSGSSNRVSEKVDVFSFGIVMWEILTGEEPYANMHCGAIIGGIVNNTLRPPIPKRCDSEWKKLMEECWSADPASRPSFTEITNRLRDMSMALPKKRQNVTSRRV